MIIPLLVAALALAPQAQEGHPKVPKDSLLLVVTGCLKGRVLAPAEVRQPDVQTGPEVHGRSFRLAAKGDVMKDIKKQDGRLVRVTGLVRKNALAEPGFKVGNNRVIIGAPSPSMDPTRNPARDPIAPTIVMDVSLVEPLGEVCGQGVKP
ncbi:MAG TPA: hypothetical protein VFK20_16310 [Vicinamibacterales bacterium]|nr:hypothetical protein [Vicinamibacterales bacterium]